MLSGGNTGCVYVITTSNNGKKLTNRFKFLPLHFWFISLYQVCIGIVLPPGNSHTLILLSQSKWCACCFPLISHTEVWHLQKLLPSPAFSAFICHKTNGQWTKCKHYSLSCNAVSQYWDSVALSRWWQTALDYKRIYATGWERERKRHNCIFICYFSTTDSATDLSIHSTDWRLIFHSHGWGQLNSPSANLPERWQAHKRDAFWSFCEHGGWQIRGDPLYSPTPKPLLRDWTNLYFLLIVADSSWCLELWLIMRTRCDHWKFKRLKLLKKKPQVIKDE